MGIVPSIQIKSQLSQFHLAYRVMVLKMLFPDQILQVRLQLYKSERQKFFVPHQKARNHIRKRKAFRHSRIYWIEYMI